MGLSDASGSEGTSPLRILLISPSLEPGKDGVGDYTLRLAETLREKGVRVCCLSLADRFIAPDSKMNVEASQDEGAMRTIRLSAATGWSERIASLQLLIDSFQPDLISLQYVPYGYQSKGLPWMLAGRLSSLCGNFRWHVMFHELWIGWGKQAPVRERLLGLLQAGIVRQIYRKLRPVSSTSNPQHQSLLEGLGIQSDLLPLFSNIPRTVDIGAIQRLTSDFFLERPRSEWLLLGSFGAVYSDFSGARWIQWIASRSQAAGLKVAFWFIGHSSRMRDQTIAGLKRKFGDQISILDLGPREPEVISGFLQFVDAGIVTTPPEILGKSGVAASMREHGLRFYNSHRLESGEESIDLTPSTSRELPISEVEQTASRMIRLAAQP
jgi:Glycosyl transferase 4-like domain